MKRLTLLVVALCCLASALPCLAQTSQIGTFVLGKDQCAISPDHAVLLGSYLCPLQNEQIVLYSFSFIGDVEHDGVVYGWAGCHRDSTPTNSKIERIDALNAGTCDCWNYWEVENTVLINPSCTAASGTRVRNGFPDAPIKQLITTVCTF